LTTRPSSDKSFSHANWWNANGGGWPMDEVITLAARQVAGEPEDVEVSHRITVVPMKHIDAYLQHEIINEGKWATGRQPIILYPAKDTGLADNRWLSTTIERMHEARRRLGTPPSTIPTGEGDAITIDIGLVDVTVFFQMPLGRPPCLPPKAQYKKAFEENYRHFLAFCGGTLHDQMIIAACMHVFHADGWPLLHYHNLIFGLRQNVRGDMNILLSPLDLDPLLKVLAKSGPLSIITGVNPIRSTPTRIQPRWPDWVSPIGPQASAASDFPGSTHTHHPNIQTLRAILELPEDQIDLAKAKLTIDHMIDPAIDVDAWLRQLGGMAAGITRAWQLANAPSLHKLNALRTYLYHPGIWNGHKPVGYNYDSDPLRFNVRNKLLPHYLTTRKGDCVSMPLLFVILGQKLGIDVTASMAPRHLFVKYRDDMGNRFDLEATAKAELTDAEAIRTIMVMTEESVANGVYMQPLTNRETVAAMMGALMQFYQEQGKPELQVAIAALSLEYFPKNVQAMTFIAVAYYQERKQRFLDVYPTPADIPKEMRSHFWYLSENHFGWFRRAEALGWREWDEAEKAAYVERVKLLQAENASSF
jgi:regulator of sirC expression with transglutaminase-like and TPR domain